MNKFISKCLSVVVVLASIPAPAFAESTTNQKSLFTDPLTVQGLDAGGSSPDQIHYLKLTPKNKEGTEGVLFETCERESFYSQGPDQCQPLGQGFYTIDSLRQRSRDLAMRTMRANTAAFISFIVIFGATYMWFSVGPIVHSPGTPHNTIILDNIVEGLGALGAGFFSLVAGGVGAFSVEWLLHPGPKSYTWNEIARKSDQNAKAIVVNVTYGTLVAHVSNILMGM